MSLEGWNAANRSLSRAEIRRVVERAFLGVSSSLDSFSLWLMIAAGATGALLVSELGNAVELLGRTGVRTVGALLAVSAILGFLARHRGVVVSFYLAMQKALDDELSRVLDEHDEHAQQIRECAEESGVVLDTEPDFHGAMEDFASQFPRPLNSWGLRRFKRSYAGAGKGGGWAVTSLALQSIYVTFQFVFLIAGFLSATWFAGQI